MSSNTVRIAKNTLMLYFRQILIMLVSLYTVRVVLNILGAEDYGIYNVVGGVVAMLSFLNSAMSSASMRFIVYELGVENSHKLQDIFSVLFTICFLLGGLCLLLLEGIGFWFLNYKMNIAQNRLNAANWVLQFSVISFFITFISVPYNATIIAHERMDIFAYISILEVLLKLGIVFILILITGDKLKIYAVLVCLVSIFQRFVYSVYCKLHFPECKKYRFLFDKQLFKSVFNYTGWSLYANLAHISYLQGLNILLNLFFGTAVNAARAIAIQVQTSVTQFITNFQLAANPQIITHYVKKEYSEMFRLAFWSSKISFFLLFLLSVPLIVYNEYILTLWLKTVPAYAVIFCQLALVISLINVITLPFTAIVQATGKLKLNSLIVGTCNLLILPVSYLFLHFGFQPEMVFYVNIFFYSVDIFLRLYIVKRLVNFPVYSFFKEVVFPILFIVIITIVFLKIFNAYLKQTFLGLAVFSIISTAQIIITIFFIGINKTEKHLVKEKIHQIKNIFPVKVA